MSTVPHNPTDSAHAEGQAAILPSFRIDLDEAVRRFETAAENLGVERPSIVELRRLCDQVMTFTAELFPGEICVRVKNDPEILTDLYFVFAIRASGDIDDLVARNDQWHRRVMRTEGSRHGLFRLAIEVH